MLPSKFHYIVALLYFLTTADYSNNLCTNVSAEPKPHGFLIIYNYTFLLHTCLALSIFYLHCFQMEIVALDTKLM